MKGFCPNCEKETSLEQVVREETFNIRGEPITVKARLLRCSECGEEFDDPSSPDDALVEAYRIYRSRKDMLQPEEIRGFRRKYHLSQKELSDLLGWGGATLSRYENGALQSEAHDRLLRLATQSENLLQLLTTKPKAIEEEKRAKLIALVSLENPVSSMTDLCEEVVGGYDPDIFSGYKPMDLYKFIQAVLFFCGKEGILKTKLNKLLFYADFTHFKHYSVSITGARYARLPFGPVPNKYNLLYATLTDETQALRVEERPVFDYVGEYYVAQVKPDLTVFSASELKVLATVKEYFEKFGSKEISEFSHKEKGYLDTENARLISYKHAESINLGL